MTEEFELWAINGEGVTRFVYTAFSAQVVRMFLFLLV